MVSLLTNAIEAEHGSSMYICGSPGFGKTLCVSSVLTDLYEAEEQRRAKYAPDSEEASPKFMIVRIQGTGVHNSTIYGEIASRLDMPEATRPEKEARIAVLKRLSTSVQLYRNRSRTRNATLPITILVIDEIDRAPRAAVKELLELARLGNAALQDGSIVTSDDYHEENLRRFCNDEPDMGGHYACTDIEASSLIVVGMANSIRFPDESGIRLEAMPRMILFEAYTCEQLKDIVRARSNGVFDTRAVDFIAGKVYTKQGDVMF
jgi:Cdc6-like AAA superfamily ATPase